MSSTLNFLSPQQETINRAVSIICPSLGACLAFAGLKKLLTNWEAGWAVYRNNGFSVAEYQNTAIVEVIGALGLIYPPTRFAGVATLISMIAWIEVRTKRDRQKPKSPLYLRIPAWGTQVLLVGLAWVLRPRF
jgi:hypothetical protein